MPEHAGPDADTGDADADGGSQAASGQPVLAPDEQALLAAFDRSEPPGRPAVGVRQCHAPHRPPRHRCRCGCRPWKGLPDDLWNRGGRPGSVSGSWATWPGCWPTSWPPTPGPRPMPPSRWSWGPFRGRLGRTPISGRPGGAARGPHRPARLEAAEWPLAAPDPGEWSGRSTGGWAPRTRATRSWSANPATAQSSRPCGRPGAGWWASSRGVRRCGRRWRRPGWRVGNPPTSCWPMCRPPPDDPRQQHRRGRPARVRRSTGPGRQGRTARRVGADRRAGRHHRRAGHRPGGLGRGPLRPGPRSRAGPAPPPRDVVVPPRADWVPPTRSGTVRPRAPSMRWWPGWNDERHPPVRPHAPPARRGGGAHAGPARPAGGVRGAIDHLLRDPRSGHRRPDPPLPGVRGRGRGRRRAGLPVRHRVGDGRLAGPPTGAGGPQLPQHHPTEVLRPVEQRDHPAAGGRATRAGPAGAPGRAGHRGVPLRRAGAAGGRLPAHRGDPGGQRVGAAGRARPCRPRSAVRPPARAPGTGGCRSDGWPPTRATTRPSPPSSWPGRRPTPTPA